MWSVRIRFTKAVLFLYLCFETIGIVYVSNIVLVKKKLENLYCNKPICLFIEQKHKRSLIHHLRLIGVWFLWFYISP